MAQLSFGPLEITPKAQCCRAYLFLRRHVNHYFGVINFFPAQIYWISAWFSIVSTAVPLKMQWKCEELKLFIPDFFFQEIFLFSEESSWEHLVKRLNLRFKTLFLWLWSYLQLRTCLFGRHRTHQNMSFWLFNNSRLQQIHCNYILPEFLSILDCFLLS